MGIIYQEIDANLLEEIAAKYGEMAEKHIHTENHSFSLVAVCDDTPIGFISAYTRNLTAPIGEEEDAYIDIIEVDNEYQRMGIATELVTRTEEWANIVLRHCYSKSCKRTIRHIVNHPRKRGSR